MAQRTEGERALLDQFSVYIGEIFDHGDAHCGTSLADLIVLQAFDLVDAASLLADNEFGAEIAAELCRKALRWRKLGFEITKFLDAETADERAALPSLENARYQAELRAKLRQATAAPDPEARSRAQVIGDLRAILDAARSNAQTVWANARQACAEDATPGDRVGTLHLVDDFAFKTAEDLEVARGYINELEVAS